MSKYYVQVEFSFDVIGGAGILTPEEIHDIKQSFVLDLQKDFNKAEDIGIEIEKAWIVSIAAHCTGGQYLELLSGGSSRKKPLTIGATRWNRKSATK